jgi:sulfur-oxidizing protein SoxY
MIRLAATICLATAAPAAAQLDDPAAREARWSEVRRAIFGERAVAVATRGIAIDAPLRAQDAALVPVTLAITDPAVAAVHLVIDENPSPYAAHLRFGPAAVRDGVAFRVRVNGYTTMHAVAEHADGRLAAVSRFVKASGGCSAPIEVSDEEAMAGMGAIRMTFAPAAKYGRVDALVMIRHPNFTGMQMNQVTRLTTPPRYIERLEVTIAGRSIFALDGDISLSANPAIGFAFAGKPGDEVTVVATDSAGARWEQRFTVPTAAS